jgi:hypothetical protein
MAGAYDGGARHSVGGRHRLGVRSQGVTFRLTTRPGHPTFVDLPWEQPLESWESGRLVTPVRGISRHVVRFVAYGDAMYALKEEQDDIAHREYRLLRDLEEGAAPVVEAVGVASGRTATDGELLEAVLITRHLPFSLPYRVLFARQAIQELRVPMLDALAELFVQLHLNGFFWGDCSLSNTLFRRDAGRLRAFLVDAETGEQHPTLSAGQRAHDLLIAQENVAGELLDLAARARPEGSDLDIEEALAVGEDLVRRYEGLWAEVTRDEVVGVDEQHRIAERVNRLNELGFDVEELELVGSGEQLVVRVRTQVVEPGHHRRRLLALTGIDAGENQARVLLNDILRYRLWLERSGGVPVAESVGAVRWLVEVFEPTLAAVPESLTARLEPPELFHQILEHRWFLSEQRGGEVDTAEAVTDYVANVLPLLPEDRLLLPDPPTQPVPIVSD